MGSGLARDRLLSPALPPFKNAKGFAEFIFWYELSHYLDHENGRNTRNKQTKADRFAIGMMGKFSNKP